MQQDTHALQSCKQRIMPLDDSKNAHTDLTKPTTYTPQRILLGVTGSVAAVKAPEIATRLATMMMDLENDIGKEDDGKKHTTNRDRSQQVQVKVVLTAGGQNFWNKAQEYNPMAWYEFQTILAKHDDTITIHESDEEWRNWQRIGDEVMHIELRKWATMLLIAPLSAHTLAKLSHGLCDDTLSCVARAWKYDADHPVILAPAMNTAMWQHPLTQQQLTTIQSFASTSSGHVSIVAPQVKTLACGDVGDGALASVDEIIHEVRRVLLRKRRHTIDRYFS